MMISKQFLLLVLVSPIFLASCSVSMLEARLEADPQCKPVMNAKTGALMPCVTTDKEFYRSLGLMAPAPKVNATQEVLASTQNTAGNPSPAPQSTLTPLDCKPQLHQKSGSLMPCPAP